MKSLRWGVCVLAVGGVVALSGCKSMGRWLSPSEYEKYRSLERLNADQGSLISSLTYEKERLTNEVNALKAQAEDRGALLEAQKRVIENMQSQIQATPDLPGGLSVGMKPSGEAFLGMEGDVLFASGEATLKPSGERILKKAVELVRDRPNQLAICGFTDSDPIKRSRWPSNFALSGQRALTVLDFLEKNGISADRMHFRGYGQYSLVYDANGKENKAKSRRAEIILLNAGEGTGPAPAAVTPK